MASQTHYVRYHAISRASVNEWVKMQQQERPILTIFFQDRNATVYLLDRIEEKGIKLHNGLDIVVSFNNHGDGDIINEANGLVDLVLDAISFITMTHCELDRIDSLIVFNDDGTSHGGLSVLGSSDINLYVPRTINKDVLANLFNARDKLGETDKNRISRALNWLRASIIQKSTVFQFMCLWIALETINPTLCDKLKPIKGKKSKRGKKWRGLIDIFNNKIKNVNFDDVRNARVQLFHSLGEMSQDFTAKLERFLEPMRKAFIYGIGSVLELNEEAIDIIADKKPLKYFEITSAAYKGKFENLQNNIDWLLGNYPEFRIGESQKKYYLNDQGNPNVDISLSNIATFPGKVRFTAEAMVMSGDRDAGVEPKDFRIKD